MKNNKHWNTVDWSQIPEDVEAVVTFKNDAPSYYKVSNGKLLCECYRWEGFDESNYDSMDCLSKHFNECFHLRPTPSTQPIPEPPESTQVESSQVEATSVPEFDWSTVEDDVEAVIIYEEKCTQLLKTVDGHLQYSTAKFPEYYSKSCWYSTLDEREKCISHYKDGTATLLRRPPATPPNNKVDDQPITCKVEFYEGTLPEGMIDFDPAKVIAGDKDLQQICSGYKVKVHGGIPVKYEVSKVDKIGEPSVPSIQSILSDAQGLIKKHHNVTGEVKFTIKVG